MFRSAVLVLSAAVVVVAGVITPAFTTHTPAEPQPTSPVAQSASAQTPVSASATTEDTEPTVAPDAHLSEPHVVIGLDLKKETDGPIPMWRATFLDNGVKSAQVSETILRSVYAEYGQPTTNRFEVIIDMDRNTIVAAKPAA